MQKEKQSPLIIAIDGPAASGKSTVARRIASRMGIVFVSSGEMYRAFAWWVLENNINPTDTQRVLQLLEKTEFVCGAQNGVGTVKVSGHLMTRNELSAEEVNRSVSQIATIPAVRQRLVSEQRRYAVGTGVVMEGRDIGSVVFPDAHFKFYIDAAPEVRETRRRSEGILDSIAQRDRTDSSRPTSPLVIPEGAVVVDSSHLGIEEVVERVMGMISAK